MSGLPLPYALAGHELSLPSHVICSPMHEAFGEAYDEQAAARSGKRQKRSGGPSAAAVAAAAANDPTRARVEGILASMQPALPVAGAAGGVDEVMHEQI